jgi:hypothetical protein
MDNVLSSEPAKNERSLHEQKTQKVQCRIQCQGILVRCKKEATISDLDPYLVTTPIWSPNGNAT